MGITWRRLERSDFALLRGWLEQPHVQRWWYHDTTPEAVERDFGPAAGGEEPSEDLLALVDDRPLGLLQRCYLRDYPEYAAELGALVAVPDGAMTIDYLIGDQKETGKGRGTAMIRSAVHHIWTDHPAVPAILVPVVAANPASWRALEKSGFTRVGTGELKPDNPVDDWTHHLYRVDRPAAGA
ncbi:GNAT family N-acetyltransferase [Streptomyces boninensis]|uniref:GNAT family N-acetyltransferase n=1 Tax=Streptomyces boninensis TaxID=2039455 RepID=UPI003B20CDEC